MKTLALTTKNNGKKPKNHRNCERSASRIDIVRHLGHRPAVYFFGRPRRAMSGSNRVCILVARIVEMYDLLQALQVAVVKNSFWK
jgi:hypothetical protein